MSLPCPFCSAFVTPEQAQCTQCGGVLDGLLSEGARVGTRFQVVEAMTHGALCSTYRARDLGTGVDLALKVLAHELVSDAPERAAFVARIEMFGGRTIAGCAMPLEVGTDEQCAFVTAPLIDGVFLRDVLAARKALGRPLDVEEALRVLLALSASLSALHSATPHGSLGPETVMVTGRGLILTDCAIAVAVPIERLQMRLQRYRRGGPYVSPEAARGRRISAVADLYALGAIACELLTGSPEREALESVPVDPEVAAAVRTLMHSDPSKRSGAVGVLLDALSQAAGFATRPSQSPLPVPDVPLPPVRASRTAMPRTSGTPSVPAPASVKRPPSEATVTAHGRPSAPPKSGGGRIPSLPPALGQPSPATRTSSVPPARPTSTVPPATPQRPTSSVPPAAPVARPERTRDLEGIDPRLLRAARKLEAAKRTEEGEEVDTGEIEVLEE